MLILGLVLIRVLILITNTTTDASTNTNTTNTISFNTVMKITIVNNNDRNSWNIETLMNKTQASAHRISRPKRFLEILLALVGFRVDGPFGLLALRLGGFVGYELEP